MKVRDFTKMTDTLRRVLRAAEATCGDSILHNAACGDKESKNKILDKTEDYFHKVAIAGHVSLLNAIIDQRPDMVNFPDAITGPTPFINAARGGWSTCLKYRDHFWTRKIPTAELLSIMPDNSRICLV